ncbi:MAG: hypothetical protein RMJ67_09915, partial [Elusimicrobiota bacterium]|nr:hypothetical protein [Endomicrobiia bacterium]MDW8166810.1 hypothetical protein [Elusimicrobiota bacterium]
SYTLPINPMFFEMYEKSKEMFLDGDRVFEKIDEANRTMPEGCRIISYRTCGYNPRESMSLLEENCPKAIVRFNDSMIRLLEEVSNLDFSRFKYEIKVIDVKSLINYKVTYTTGGCCSWSCTRFACWCVAYYHYFTHYYYYNGAAKVYVNVTTKEDFPLYEDREEKTNRRQIVLRFSVISSNNYTWMPIG